MQGLDYSWARPGAANIKAKGYGFVCRYLSYDAGKNISKAEADDLLNNGLGIILVWESTANRSLAGRAAGIADANEALRQANAVGQPDFLPIFFAVDFDTTPGQQAAIDEYLRGAGTVLGQQYVGVYGSFYVVQRCFNNGSARWGWQTYAWSGGQIEGRAHIYQYANGAEFGGQADINRSLQSNFGGWFKAVTPTPIPTPVPVPVPVPPVPKNSPSPSVSPSVSPSESPSVSPSSSVSPSISPIAPSVPIIHTDIWILIQRFITWLLSLFKRR